LKATLPSSFTFSARAVLSSSGSGVGLSDDEFSTGFGLGEGGGGVLDPAPGLAVAPARLDGTFNISSPLNCELKNTLRRHWAHCWQLVSFLPWISCSPYCQLKFEGKRDDEHEEQGRTQEGGNLRLADAQVRHIMSSLIFFWSYHDLQQDIVPSFTQARFNRTSTVSRVLRAVRHHNVFEESLLQIVTDDALNLNVPDVGTSLLIIRCDIAQ
jgi:hypothetical protein